VKLKGNFQLILPDIWGEASKYSVIIQREIKRGGEEERGREGERERDRERERESKCSPKADVLKA
jgi:hypothetical protein